jgi:predicted thioesterase
MDLQPGLSARVDATVTEADTAATLGSGDVPVLGTPRAVALAEAATVAALDGHLPEGRTTVGVRVELDHLVASPVGATVAASATLSTVDGKRLAFEVTLHDGDRVAARGRVVRAVVDRATFLAGVVR